MSSQRSPQSDNNEAEPSGNSLVTHMGFLYWNLYPYIELGSWKNCPDDRKVPVPKVRHKGAAALPPAQSLPPRGKTPRTPRLSVAVGVGDYGRQPPRSPSPAHPPHRQPPFVRPEQPPGPQCGPCHAHPPVSPGRRARRRALRSRPGPSAQPWRGGGSLRLPQPRSAAPAPRGERGWVGGWLRRDPPGNKEPEPAARRDAVRGYPGSRPRPGRGRAPAGGVAALLAAPRLPPPHLSRYWWWPAAGAPRSPARRWPPAGKTCCLGSGGRDWARWRSGWGCCRRAPSPLPPLRWPSPPPRGSGALSAEGPLGGSSAGGREGVRAGGEAAAILYGDGAGQGPGEEEEEGGEPAHPPRRRRLSSIHSWCHLRQILPAAAPGSRKDAGGEQRPEGMPRGAPRAWLPARPWDPWARAPRVPAPRARSGRHPARAGYP